MSGRRARHFSKSFRFDLLFLVSSFHPKSRKIFKYAFLFYNERKEGGRIRYVFYLVERKNAASPIMPARPVEPDRYAERNVHPHLFSTGKWHLRETKSEKPFPLKRELLRLCFSTKGRRLWAVSCAFIMRVKTPPLLPLFLFFLDWEPLIKRNARYNGPRMERRRHSSHLPGLDKLIYFDVIVSGLSRICSGEFRRRSMIPDHGGQYLPRTSMKYIHRCFTTFPSPPPRSYFILLSFRPPFYIVISKATSIQNPFLFFSSFFFFRYSNSRYREDAFSWFLTVLDVFRDKLIWICSRKFVK